MTLICVYAGSLERMESLVFAKDPVRSRVGDPERFYERVYSERTLGSFDDPDAASETLRAILLGPVPQEPLTETYATVFRSILEALCVRVDDDAFGASSLAAVRTLAHRLAPALGPAFPESLETRHLSFLSFEPRVHSPLFSYWTHAELRHFLERYEAATAIVQGDIDASDRLRQLQGTWRATIAQGPDAILAITL
ncbi:MAG: hypothetical protein HYY16_17170 [Planctomycetes bacterium]|nr:hypothetical protein [Planctomycetota bacterium]